MVFAFQNDSIIDKVYLLALLNLDMIFSLGGEQGTGNRQ